jgi:hypothetical protein
MEYTVEQLLFTHNFHTAEILEPPLQAALPHPFPLCGRLCPHLNWLSALPA